MTTKIWSYTVDVEGVQFALVYKYNNRRGSAQENWVENRLSVANLAQKCLFGINMRKYLNGEIFEFYLYLFLLARGLVFHLLPLRHYDACMGVCDEVQQHWQQHDSLMIL